jgi:exopolysaccharide biosynthesis polyprenyl glycosylphosphotransferase
MRPRNARVPTIVKPGVRGSSAVSRIATEADGETVRGLGVSGNTEDARPMSVDDHLEVPAQALAGGLDRRPSDSGASWPSVDSATIPLRAVGVADGGAEVKLSTSWLTKDGPLGDLDEIVGPRSSVPVVLTVLDAVWGVAATSVVAVTLGSWEWVACLPVLVALFLAAAARNRHHFGLSVRKDTTAMATAGLATTLAAASATATVGGAWSSAPPHAWASHAWAVLVTGLVVVLGAVVGHVATVLIGRDLRRRGFGTTRAVIIGGGQTAQCLRRGLAAHPEYGVEVVGDVDDVENSSARHRKGGAREPRSLADVIQAHRADLLLVALGEGGCHTFVDSGGALRDRRCAVYVVPRLYRQRNRAFSWDSIGGMPLVRLRGVASGSLSLRAKRLLDILGAGFGLLLTAPVLVVVALAVRHETGPGFIFRQERIGMNGRPFTLYKFRSLKPSAGEGDTRWTIHGDPRLGPVGKFIRASSLDELPQLVNVLRGDMSLVGPRPERPHFVDNFSGTVPGYDQRHRMPVGLTGLAALNGLRGDTGIPERSHYDNLYIDSWSFWLDLKIIIRTMIQLALGKG